MNSLKDILLRMAKRDVAIAVEVLQREGKIPIDPFRCGKVDTMKLKRIHNLKEIPFSVLKDKSEQTLLDDIEKKNIVDDGFGNAWAKCGHSECDLHVVRPGKVQCNGYCEEEVQQ